MKKLTVRIIKLCALVCLVLPLVKMDVLAYGLGAPAGGEHGSGSYQLNKVGADSRFYTEYYVGANPGKNYKTATIQRKTSIQVYAKKDEVILFGSSVSDSQINDQDVFTGAITGQDIVITPPVSLSGPGMKISFDVLTPGQSEEDGTPRPYGLGYISSHTQEKNGPMVNYDDQAHPEMYYVPLTYTVPGDGIYTFEFHSVTGTNDGSLPTVVPASSDAWNQNKTTVAAWDITVLGKDDSDNWEVKTGRAWANYLALTTGGQDAKADLDVFVLSHDGYRYKVNFKEAAPFGFIFFANNTGFMTHASDGTDRPIYHSFYDATNDLDNMESNENIFLHKPNEADTPTEETYKIFFNKPSGDLDSAGIGIKTDPQASVTLKDLTFTGNSKNVTYSGHGGKFTFNSDDEAMITIRLDLRKAILDSGIKEDVYNGSGIVEITAPATEGDNTFNWDGKDTDGIVIPPGIYGNQNVVLSSEIKRGELHFPVIDMEGLYGGLTVHRENGEGADTDPSRYDLYYNNNPLLYGTIEGKEARNYNRVTKAGYDELTDGTKSRKRSVSSYFTDLTKVSTLKRDSKEYLANLFFNSSYASLPADEKAIIDAEFDKEQDTFHHEPVNSFTPTMYFAINGGDMAGIDAWTYYTSGIKSEKISFAVLDDGAAGRGVITGQVFYDSDKSSSYDAGADKLLPNIKVRLIDSTGIPVVHKESLPCFDDSGHFIYNPDGTVKHELKSVKFESSTDINGTYRFVGVPYESGDTTYYVQVMLTDVQSEVLRYTCTTSEEIKENLIDSSLNPFITESIAGDCGADGNKIVAVHLTDPSKIYGYKYARNADNDTVFDIEAGIINVKNTQSVTLPGVTVDSDTGICSAEFKKIGYCSTVPSDNQKNYVVHKNWGPDYKGEDTHQISDGIIVELYVWNDDHVKEDNTLSLSRRTGALMDTQVLNTANGWTYTWNNLDNRLQYYVLEYYTKKKPNGEVIYNDKGEPRQVLIGGTMPIFDVVPAEIATTGIYGFANVDDYSEKVEYPADSGIYRIPIQKFGDGKTHHNSITSKEKLESVDNNARQYNVTYTLTKSADEKTNTIELTNSQTFDDRTYYVWLNHETKLPDFMAETYVEHSGGTHTLKSHAVTLQSDKPIPNTDEYTIKGLSVSSMDAAHKEYNYEGSSTDIFRVKATGTTGADALFTATKHGNYTTGTGTRTYRVKYVVNSSTKQPVSVTTNDAGKLVDASNQTPVEGATGYTVYSWYMTIHVYDVEPDGIIEYDPNGGPIVLQSALTRGNELKWTLNHDPTNEYAVTYTSNDPRTSGLLKNDVLRVPLYKTAVESDMGSCADVVGIAYYGGPYSPDSVDGSMLPYEDTYQSRYGDTDDGNEIQDGTASAVGINSGIVTVKLNPTRITRVNRTQDHANYAEITFKPTPSATGLSRAAGSGLDTFFYKIVVFSEDNTYQYGKYEDIDALSGVVMYTYFTMKPKGMEVPDPYIDPNWYPNAYPMSYPSDPIKKFKEQYKDLKNRDPKAVSPRSGE